jgi:hypothetical protein
MWRVSPRLGSEAEMMMRKEMQSRAILTQLKSTSLDVDSTAAILSATHWGCLRGKTAPSFLLGWLVAAIQTFSSIAWEAASFLTGALTAILTLVSKAARLLACLQTYLPTSRIVQSS